MTRPENRGYFRNVPLECVDLLGRIVVVSAAIETIAHRIAALLSQDTTRDSFGEVVRRRIRPHIDDAVLVEMGLDRPGLAGWCRTAPDLMFEHRDKHLHVNHFEMRRPDEQWQAMVYRLRQPDDWSTNTPERLRTSLAALEDCDRVVSRIFTCQGQAGPELDAPGRARCATGIGGRPQRSEDGRSGRPRHRAKPGA